MYGQEIVNMTSAYIPLARSHSYGQVNCKGRLGNVGLAEYSGRKDNVFGKLVSIFSNTVNKRC